MPVVPELCPACSAPLFIQPGEHRLQCSYCGAALNVQQNGDSVTVERVIDTIERGDEQTQAEMRRLRLTQELTSLEVRLASVQSEMRTIQRGTINAVSRKQLEELHEKSIEYQQRIHSLQAELYPKPPPATTTTNRTIDQQFSPQRIGWMLFSFRGRTNRVEFWIGVLISFAIYLAWLLTVNIANVISGGDSLFATIGTAIFSTIAFVQLVALFWVALSTGIKRLHDRDKAGWWMLLVLIPLLGAIWLLVDLGFQPGSAGTNRYG